MSEKKLLTVVDKSTKALAAQSLALSKVVAELQGLATLAEDMGQDIAEKQAKIDSLDQEVNDKQRLAAAELKIRIKEDEDKVFNELRNKRQIALITTSNLTALEDELAAAKVNNKAEIDKQVEIVTNNLKNAHNNELTQVRAEQNVETAALKASIQALEFQVETLSAQNAQLQSNIDAERQARISVAQAEAGKTTNFNVGGAK